MKYYGRAISDFLSISFQFQFISCVNAFLGILELVFCAILLNEDVTNINIVEGLSVTEIFSS